MQSPFEIFRKHQKVLTVILTGLAMFAFVILGAVPDPTHMPPALTAIFLACVLGGIGWVGGIRKKKSNEWGLIGVVAGLVLGIVGTVAVGPQAAVRADTGNIDEQELGQLRRQRELANQFVYGAYQRAQKNGAPLYQTPPTFGFGHPDPVRDVVVGELLRREADRLGLQVADEGVTDFIRSLSQEKLGASDVREIRDQMGLSESGLYEILRQELRAVTMARFLYGGTTLPPEAYWDFYRQMNIQQSVAIVPVPVQAFIDKSAQPAPAELQELFTKHKSNLPNLTEQGRLNEGNPGFYQPRRVALEYIEIPYEAIEKTVGEVTDEEIQAHYNEFYKAPAAPADADVPDAPQLPPLEEGDAKLDTKMPPRQPEGDNPADAATVPESDSAKTPDGTEQPADASPAGQPNQAPREQPQSEPVPETPAPAPADAPQSAPEQAPSESSSGADAPPESEPAPEATSGQTESGASLRRPHGLQLVAFQDEELPAESSPQSTRQEGSAAQEAPSAEDSPQEGKPQADTSPSAPAAQPEEKSQPADNRSDTNPATPTADSQPADDVPSSAPKAAATSKDAKAMQLEKADDGTAPAADADGNTPPPAPQDPATEPPKPRELDDELRSEIREQILRRKTSERQQELMNELYDYMSQELAYNVTAPEDDPSHISPAATSKELQEFAAANGLVYERTPLLSARELSRSEEYPIGQAVSATNFQSSGNVAQMAFNAAPTDVFRPEQVVDIDSGSRFVFWKVEDVAAYEPASLDAPGIREQVVRTWRELQAREKARQRAQELAKQAAGREQSLSEILADTTVTGKAGGQQVSVVHPPRFAWLTRVNPQMSPNPFNRPAPQLTELRTVPGIVGEQFMETVVNELQEGEVGVTHSLDKEYYYVVKVEERTFGASADLQAFREAFTRQPLFAPIGYSDYATLASRELASYRTGWADELFRRHGVDFSGLDQEDAKERSEM